MLDPGGVQVTKARYLLHPLQDLGGGGESLVRVCQLELSNPVPELLILS